MCLLFLLTLWGSRQLVTFITGNPLLSMHQEQGTIAVDDDEQYLDTHLVSYSNLLISAYVSLSFTISRDLARAYQEHELRKL